MRPHSAISQKGVSTLYRHHRDSLRSRTAQCLTLICLELLRCPVIEIIKATLSKGPNGNFSFFGPHKRNKSNFQNALQKNSRRWTIPKITVMFVVTLSFLLFVLLAYVVLCFTNATD
jgi:hypothetical protein